MPVNPILPPNPSTQVRPAGGTKNREGLKKDSEGFTLTTPADEITIDKDRGEGSPKKSKDKEERHSDSEHPGTEATDDQELGQRLDITA